MMFRELDVVVIANLLSSLQVDETRAVTGNHDQAICVP
jgi:hypothetical protein